MAGLSAGVVAAGDINSQAPRTGGLSGSPAMWSYVWFIISCLYLVGIYYGHISIREKAV